MIPYGNHPALVPAADSDTKVCGFGGSADHGFLSAGVLRCRNNAFRSGACVRILAAYDGDMDGAFIL
jgi:hypothetical protein